MTQQQALVHSLGEQRLILADWFVATSAEIVLSTHRVEEALTLAEEAVTYAHSVDGKYAEGLAQRVWGQALAALTPAHWDEVEEHMTSSLQAFEACEMLPEIARTHRTWGLLKKSPRGMYAECSQVEYAQPRRKAWVITSYRATVILLIPQ